MRWAGRPWSYVDILMEVRVKRIVCSGAEVATGYLVILVPQFGRVRCVVRGSGCFVDLC